MAMSALGQKHTSEHVQSMSALPSKAESPFIRVLTWIKVPTGAIGCGVVNHPSAPKVMTPADEMGFDNQFEDQLRSIVKEASLQPRLVEDLHGSEDAQSLLFSLLSRHLDHESTERKAIYRRLQTIEKAIKRRRSRGIVRYLVAMGIGVAATLTWQSYGEATKQIIATKAPVLGWSLETKQMITGWMQQLGLSKQP